jgi:hypothetical protein
MYLEHYGKHLNLMQITGWVNNLAKDLVLDNFDLLALRLDKDRYVNYKTV